MSDASLEMGSVVAGRYRVTRPVGRGGMGEVFEAEQVGLGRRVVLKTVVARRRGQKGATERLLREARAAAAIQHPNVAMVHEILEHDAATAVMVMEWIEGPTLSQTIGAVPQDPEEVVGWMRQLLGGLQAAHAVGVVHRDLKPSNLMITDAPGLGPLLKILDFGLARFLDHERSVTITQTGQVVGTPGYMAPEQVSGQPVDERTDLFATGVIAFRALTGQLPFAGDTQTERLVALMEAPPTRLSDLRPDVPPALAAIVHRAIEKDPARRYQSAAEMVAALEDWRGDAASTARAPTIEPSLLRRAAVVAALALFGFVVAAGSAVGVLQLLEEDVPPATAGPPDQPSPPPEDTPTASPPGPALTPVAEPTAEDAGLAVMPVAPVEMGSDPREPSGERSGEGGAPEGRGPLQLRFVAISPEGYSRAAVLRFWNSRRLRMERCMRERGVEGRPVTLGAHFDATGTTTRTEINPEDPYEAGGCSVEAYTGATIEGGAGHCVGRAVWRR